MENEIIASEPNLFIPSYETVSKEDLDKEESNIGKRHNPISLKDQRKIKSDSIGSIDSEDSIFQDTLQLMTIRRQSRKPLFRPEPYSFEYSENIERKDKEKNLETSQMITDTLRGHFVFKNLDTTLMYIQFDLL